jgi:hypothetical protein
MNRNTSTAALLTSLALLLIFVAGCETAKIGDINRDPGRYAGKEVTISGRVINSFGALGEGAFELEDGSGSIWVLSAGFGVPVQGAHVKVTGRVEEGVTFAGKGFGIVLRETQPRHGG